jgi:hypothetical protein
MASANVNMCTSFGHDVAPFNTVSDLYNGENGSPTITVGGGRFGSNSVHVVTSASTVNVTMQPGMNSSSAPSAQARQMYSWYFKFTTKPSGAQTFNTFTSNAGSTASLQINSSGVIEIVVGSGSAVSTGVNPVTGIWYRADMIYRLDLNPRTATVYITQDGAVDYLAGPITATGTSETASTGRWLVLGSLSSSTMTVDYADVVGSNNAGGSDGDFPIIPRGYHHRVASVTPNADGTHSVGADNFRYTDNNGTGFTNMTNSTTDSWSRVNVWPPVADGNAADHWVEKNSGTTLANYVLWKFQPVEFSAVETPFSVHFHAAIKASATTADTCALYSRYVSTDDATLINTGTVGSTTTVYRGHCYPLAPDGNSWDQPHLTGLTTRFSSDSVTAIPQVKAVIAEVAFLYAGGGEGIWTSSSRQNNPGLRAKAFAV